MARLTFWNETCVECGQDLDIHEDEYMEIEDEIWCMECYEDKHQEDEKFIRDTKDNGVRTIKMPWSKDDDDDMDLGFGDIDSSKWGMDVDDTNRCERTNLNYFEKQDYYEDNEIRESHQNISPKNLNLESTPYRKGFWWNHNLENKFEHEDGCDSSRTCKKFIEKLYDRFDMTPSWE